MASKLTYSVLVLAVLVSPLKIGAATLKPETVAAWDGYVKTVIANLQMRIHPGGRFLWTFEDPQRAGTVRSGEIVVAPAGIANPQKVPGGLIHHWMGAVFVPGLTIDQLLEVTTDYDHYQQFYRPYVMESKTIGRDAPDDKFSMLLMNRSFLQKTALDTDDQVTHVRLDERRLYSISRTTRVQEVEEFGRSEEHRKAEGEGGGILWKLLSVARLEQRDGGVYVELEAIALSRDIPAALHFVVDPIVRRVSRNSMLISLRQTEQAASERFAQAAQSSGDLAIEEHGRSLPLSNHGSAFTKVH